MIKYVPKEIKENVNVSRQKPLSDFFFHLFALVIIILTAFFLFNLLAALTAPFIPLQFEKKLGFLVEKKFCAGKVENKTQHILQEKLDRLTGLLPEKEQARDYKICLVDNKTVNALALPGGTIVIYSGLIDQIKTGREMDFVIAHELGHFVNRDHLKKLGRALTLYLFLSLLGNDNPSISLLTQISRKIELKFSRAQEKKADLYALDLIYRLHGSYDGVNGFFESILKKENQPELIYFFSTHPAPGKRIHYLHLEIERRSKEKN